VFDTLGIAAAKIALIRELFSLVKPHGAEWAGPHAHAAANTFLCIDLDGARFLIAEQVRFFLGACLDTGRPAALLADIRDSRKNPWKRSLTLMRDLAGLISPKWCVEQANSHNRQAVHFSRLTSMNLLITAPFHTLFSFSELCGAARQIDRCPDDLPSRVESAG
jgi:hypothetical protein